MMLDAEGVEINLVHCPVYICRTKTHVTLRSISKHTHMIPLPKHEDSLEGLFLHEVH